MHYVTLVLFAAALAGYADVVLGLDQHMICKTVESVFEAPNSQAGSASPMLQGREGKRGVKGDRGIQGLKGQKGIQGTVDMDVVRDIIQEGISTATQVLKEKIVNLESQISEMNRTMLEQQPRSCSATDGFLYKGKCYYAIVHETSDVALSELNRLCGENGGKPADIINKELQTLMEDEIRKKMPSSQTIVNAWLSLAFNPATRQLTSSSGAMRSLRWHPTYPRSGSSYSAYTAVRMQVYKDATSINNSIYNIPPSDNTYAFVCEI